MHAFSNPAQTPCIYYLAMDVSGDPVGVQHRLAPVVDINSHLAEASKKNRKETGARNAKKRGRAKP
jgi:hypothetical protein